MDTNIDRVAALERDLAAAQSYATTLAVSMHRQHYAEAAPNWQPLPDLAGLLTQIDNMYAGLRNDLEAAEVENKRLVGANLAELLRIKEAADVLYSEAEEYDLPDGLGMGASQQYWDDLADALFPDDSGEVIQADLENVQAAVDGAWEAFNEELNKPEFLPCGHHHSMMLKSAETGEPLYCELCDCISRRNDAERDLAAAQAANAALITERDEARADAVALRVITPEMVKAYLDANDEYWRIQDAQALPPMKWRKGTPQQATEYSLTKMFAAIRARKDAAHD